MSRESGGERRESNVEVPSKKDSRLALSLSSNNSP